MNKIQKYFQYRQSLIDQYKKGDMTKAEYLETNYDAVVHNEIKPFKKIDSVEKGLFNYQYYNAKAKKMKTIAAGMIDSEMRQSYLEQSRQFYKKKDYATLKVLELLDYRRVDAYYVKVRSKYLKGKLIEIWIEDYQMILHTTNPMIVEKLRESFVFSEDVQQSLIDSYINQKY